MGHEFAVDTLLRDWRSDFSRRLLAIMLALAVVMMIVFSSTLTPVTAIFGVAIIAALAVLLIWRGAPEWLRNAVILGVFALTGATGLYSGRDLGAAVLYLLTGVVLTGLLASSRAALAYLAAAIGILALGAWALATETTLMAAPPLRLTPLMMIVGNAATLVAVGLLTVTSLASMMGRLRRALLEREAALVELERESQDRQRSFEQLQAAHASLQEAQASLVEAGKIELLGQLAGGIAHDMNNALTVILGEADLVHARAPEQADAIADAVEHASTLTRQLLTIGRREVVQARAIDLGEAVQGAAAMLHRTLPRSIEIQLHLRDGVVVDADPNQIQQIILNLGTNAAHALPDGGSLQLSVRRVEDRAELVVEDDGVGIDPDTLEHVFEPFFTTKPVGVGTGLGLPSVKAIVESLAGTIQCTSSPGLGTRFVIELPVSHATAHRSAPPRAIEPIAARLDGARVLVVDDEVRVRAMVTSTLQAAGAAVIDVGHAQAAIAVAERAALPFDLLWTDVVMPGGGGRALVAYFREHSPSTEIAISTGYSDDAMLTHELARGRARLVRKPFTRAELVRVAVELLARARSNAGAQAQPQAQALAQAQARTRASTVTPPS